MHSSFPEAPEGAFAERCGLWTKDGDLTGLGHCSGRVSRTLPLRPTGQTQPQWRQLQSWFAHGRQTRVERPPPRPPHPHPAARSSPGSQHSASLSWQRGPRAGWALGAGLGFQLPCTNSRSSPWVAVAAFTSDSSSFHLRQHIDASCELQFKASPDSDLKSVRDRAALGPRLGEPAEAPGGRATAALLQAPWVLVCSAVS